MSNGHTKVDMEDFKINFSMPEQKRLYLEYCQNLEGEQIICHNSVIRQRSLPMNNYYWGVVLAQISRDTGHTPEELHDIFKAEFLPTITFQRYGDLTTTNCSSKQMWSFIYRVRKFYMEFAERYIPEPNEAIRVPELTWGNNDRFYC